MMFTSDSFATIGIMLPAGTTGQVKAICPECSHTRRKQKDPCLSVNVEKGIWKCNHCEFSGSLKNGNPKLATRKIVTPPIEKPSGAISKKAAEWFVHRGISGSTLADEGITSQKRFFPQIKGETEAMAFPYILDGKTVNVKYRDYAKNMAMTKGGTLTLYRIDRIDPAQPIIITEGEIDALTCVECGIDNVVSVPNGAPSARKDSVLQLPYMDQEVCPIDWPGKVIIATDGDGPGERLREEITRRIGPERAYYLHYPAGCKDLNDVLVKHGSGAVSSLVENATAAPVQGILTASAYRDEIYEEHRNLRQRGTSTGWNTVDEKYTISPGEVTVITGVPGSGKSEWIDALMVNLSALHDWRFAVFSPENQPFPLHFKKLASKRINKPFDRGPTPRMVEKEIQLCIDWIDKRFWFIMPDDETHDLDSIIARMRVCIHRHGVNGVILDPWNEIDHRRPKTMTETEYISQSLTKIRRFARLYRVHFWVIAHPSKMRRDASGEFPTPTPYDISGSSHWYNKADNCITVERDPSNNVVNIKVQKVRHRNTGSVGQAELFYDKITGRYRGHSEQLLEYPKLEQVAEKDVDDDSEVPF